MATDHDVSVARTGSPLYLTAVAAALAFGPRGPVYWDSFGYVAQAVSGQIGGLGLGRPVFVLISHVVATLVLASGASVFAVEQVLRVFWMMMAAFSAPLTATLARTCGLSPRGATFAGLAVALSPAMAHASAAVLTDGPSVSLTLLSLVLAGRAVRHPDRPSVGMGLAAGAILGAAFGLREQSIVQAAALGLVCLTAAPTARARVAVAMLAGLVVAGTVPVLYALARDPNYPQYFATYLEGMARERTMHAYGLRDLLAYGAWLLALGPATLIFGIIGWTRAIRGATWRITFARAVCVPSLAQLVLLAGYQDISYSPRYLVAALPCALAIPAGWAIDVLARDSRRRTLAALALLAVPFVLAAPIVRWREQPTRAAVDAMPAFLDRLPPGSVVVTGQPCPAMDLYERLSAAARGAGAATWQHVCPGWQWPDDLDDRLTRARREGRVVVIDERNGAWLGREQQESRDLAAEWAARHRPDVDAGRILIWR